MSNAYIESVKLRDDYRQELIQVAAVAIAALQNLNNGEASTAGFGLIAHEIFEERVRQVEKFGVQNRHPFLWMTILGEEVGEACQAALKMEFGADEQGPSAFSSGGAS